MNGSLAFRSFATRRFVKQAYEADAPYTMKFPGRYRAS